MSFQVPEKHRVRHGRSASDERYGNNGAFVVPIARSQTVYVIAVDHTDRIRGSARLLPTDQPYLLGEVFPSLLECEPPSSREVWEMSRFTSVARPRDLGCEVFVRALATARSFRSPKPRRSPAAARMR